MNEALENEDGLQEEPQLCGFESAWEDISMLHIITFGVSLGVVQKNNHRKHGRDYNNRNSE